jgi:queuine/archaeosine tRNA-ribosyltransferase
MEILEMKKKMKSRTILTIRNISVMITLLREIPNALSEQKFKAQRWHV